MKTHTHTNLIRSSLALTLTLAAWLPTTATAVDKPMKAGGHQMMGGKMMMGDKLMTDVTMMERCQVMMEQKQKMMADMKAQDAELTEQLAKMNRAPDDKKVGLMAGVVTQMAEQRIAMNARKAMMEEEMMPHMMQHMQMGKESMGQCPMMKGMKGMDDKSADAHKGHQTEQK